MSGFLLAGGPPRAAGGPAPGPPAAVAGLATAPAPPSARPGPAADPWNGRGNTLALIAGVGVLLLAMGVGVLIGRSGSGGHGSGTPSVITIGSAAAGTSTGTASESFTGDWPAAMSGYTVQLQTLPKAGTTVAAVEAAKAAASGKGAKSVGALRSEEFSSLPSGQYIVYSGVYHSKAQASKALAGLRKSFPGARVVRVANGASSSSSSGASGAGAAGGSGAGSSLSHPAPPTVLESLKNTKGKSYEEKSKNLPDVVSTG